MLCDTNPLAKNNQATFAFNVAKDEAAKAGVDTAQYRAQLEADQAFAVHFQGWVCGGEPEADVRYVELAGPIERSVIEIYTPASRWTPWSISETQSLAASSG